MKKRRTFLKMNQKRAKKYIGKKIQETSKKINLLKFSPPAKIQMHQFVTKLVAFGGLLIDCFYCCHGNSSIQSTNKYKNY